MAFAILRHDIHGIWTVELIQFFTILCLKLPAELFDKYLVAIIGDFRMQTLGKPL